MRNFWLHLNLLNEVLGGKCGDSSDTAKFLRDFIKSFHDANDPNGRENRLVILICSIPFLVFYGALKDFHAVVSETVSSYNIIWAALKKLEDFYVKMMETEKNCFTRMLSAVESNDRSESMKAVLARIRPQLRGLNGVQRSKLDKIARQSLERSHKKFLKEKKKWVEIGEKVTDKDSFLTGTSRLVERVFGVLKNLERSHARLGLRRTFIVAEAMYNQTSEWLETMLPEKQEAIVKKAMLERPKNEKKAKELEKEDRQKYLLKNARDEEEIAQEAEMVDEEMEIGETVEDEPEVEIEESVEDEPEDQESVSMPSF